MGICMGTCSATGGSGTSMHPFVIRRPNTAFWVVLSSCCSFGLPAENRDTKIFNCLPEIMVRAWGLVSRLGFTQLQKLRTSLMSKSSPSGCPEGGCLPIFFELTKGSRHVATKNPKP